MDMEAMGQVAAANAARRTQAELAKVQANQEKQRLLDEARKGIEEDRLKVEKNASKQKRGRGGW